MDANRQRKHRPPEDTPPCQMARQGPSGGIKKTRKRHLLTTRRRALPGLFAFRRRAGTGGLRLRPIPEQTTTSGRVAANPTTGTETGGRQSRGAGRRTGTAGEHRSRSRPQVLWRRQSRLPKPRPGPGAEPNPRDEPGGTTGGKAAALVGRSGCTRCSENTCCSGKVVCPVSDNLPETTRSTTARSTFLAEGPPVRHWKRDIG